MTSVHHFNLGKPKVYKRDGMWWVLRPSYHAQRYRTWDTAIEAAVEWWFG